MDSSVVTLNKDELYTMIRTALREELNEYSQISLSEQEELQHLYFKSNLE
jgi:hypothetical protein